jgi:hypothetical protein
MRLRRKPKPHVVVKASFIVLDHRADEREREATVQAWINRCVA